MNGTQGQQRDRSVDAILDRRARQLAEPVQARQAAAQEILVFTVAEQRYGLPVEAIGEVLPGGRLARVPLSPPWLLGAMNVRGSLLAVFDLREAPPRQTAGPPAWVVLVGEDLGLAADEISGILALHDDELVGLPDAATDVGSGHLRGRTADGIAVLDAQRLIASGRFEIHGEFTTPDQREHE